MNHDEKKSPFNPATFDAIREAASINPDNYQTGFQDPTDYKTEPSPITLTQDPSYTEKRAFYTKILQSIVNAKGLDIFTASDKEYGAGEFEAIPAVSAHQILFSREQGENSYPYDEHFDGLKKSVLPTGLFFGLRDYEDTAEKKIYTIVDIRGIDIDRSIEFALTAAKVNNVPEYDELRAHARKEFHLGEPAGQIVPGHDMHPLAAFAAGNGKPFPSFI